MRQGNLPGLSGGFPMLISPRKLASYYRQKPQKTESAFFSRFDDWPLWKIGLVTCLMASVVYGGAFLFGRLH